MSEPRQEGKRGTGRSDFESTRVVHRGPVRVELDPPETLLDVPYAELIVDQEKWTRRILDFLGLPWDERCLDFHKTVRPVTTASSWQVRQKIYKSSVERWRNYEKFIGPLLDLRDTS